MWTRGQFDDNQAEFDGGSIYNWASIRLALHSNSAYPDRVVHEPCQRTWRPTIRTGNTWLGLLALSTACAHYGERPLTAPEVMLARQPDAMTVDASAIERPFLAGKPIDLSAPLDRDALGLVALLYNPDLIALRKRIGIADAQLLNARLIPDPSVDLAADRIIAGPAQTLAEGFGAQLAQNLNSLRTRNARIETVRQSLRQVRLDVAWAEWQTVQQVRIVAAQVFYLRDQKRLAEESRDAVEDLLQRSLRATGRGDLPPEQLQAARISALDVVGRVTTTNIALARSERDLRQLLGVPPAFPVNPGTPQLPTTLPTLDDLVEKAIAQRLDLTALRAGYAAEEARVRTAILNQFPALNLGFNVTRDTSDDKILGAGLNFTLPLWNRNQGGIAIQRATRAALSAEFDARVFRVRADLSRILAILAALQDQERRIAAQIEPLTRFAEQARRAASRGDLAPATATTAEQTLRDKQLLLVGIRQSLAVQFVGLELASGTPWQQWSTP